MTIVSLVTEIESKRQIVSAFNNLSHVNNLTGNSRKASDFAQHGLALSAEIGIPHDQSKSHENLVEAFVISENYKKAFEHFTAHSALEGSIMNDKLRTIEALKVRYKAEKKDQELKIQGAEIEGLLPL